MRFPPSPASTHGSAATAGRRHAVATAEPDAAPRRPRPAAIVRAVSLLLPALAAALLVGSANAGSGDEARRFLAATFALSNADLGQIEGGQVFSRTLPSGDAAEIATLGIVKVGIPPEFYVERLGEIADFKRGGPVLQIGVFGNPPDLGDVQELTLDDADIRSLSRCRIGDCGVQLSAEGIRRFRDDVDWSRGDAQERGQQVMREILVGYVADYQRMGAAASMRYSDQAAGVGLDREFTALADSGDPGWPLFPGLLKHLSAYPRAGAPGTTDLVYWSKEKVGRRTVVSITHLAIVPTGAHSPAEYAVASKQIYGTHYFHASLGLTVLVRDRAGSSPATYIAYVNRSRIDVLGGPFGGVVRRIVSGRARGTVSDQLARLQRTLEPRFAAANTP